MRDGAVDWLYLPDVSSPSLFAALLDRRRDGSFAVRPVESYEVRRRYLDGTNVLETRSVAARGELRLTDLMTPPDVAEDGEPTPQRELLRVLDVPRGEVAVEILYAPRSDYGRWAVRLRPCGALGLGLRRRRVVAPAPRRFSAGADAGRNRLAGAPDLARWSAAARVDRRRLRDAQGAIAAPKRAVDTLDALHRRGALGDAEFTLALKEAEGGGSARP